MSDRNDRLDASDLRFGERLAVLYQPEPLSASARARFAAGLDARITRRRARPAWLPALAGAACALALVWWVRPHGADDVEPAPAPRIEANAAAPLEAAGPAADWESDVLLTGEDEALDEEEYLPDDYLVIAYALIDGA